MKTKIKNNETKRRKHGKRKYMRKISLPRQLIDKFS